VSSRSFTSSAATSIEPPVQQQQQPVFEAPLQQQPPFQTASLDDYYSGDTPTLEFPLADLFGGNADEIGGT
jgi:hypothetical protein